VEELAHVEQVGAVIAWHAEPGGYSASLIVDGVCLLRLHAFKDGWQIEDRVSICKAGRSTSVGHAKRDVLEAIDELLRKASHDVEVALRET